MAMVLLLALLVPVAQAEQAPEERVTEIAARTAYILDYDWERLPDWSAREYLEAPGTVATLYCESTSADALISLVPRDSAANAPDYRLQRTMNSMVGSRKTSHTTLRKPNPESMGRPAICWAICTVMAHTGLVA